MNFILASVQKDLVRWMQDRTAVLIWLGIPFLVLESLICQDAFHRFLLCYRNVLADVFLGPLVHQKIAQKPIVSRQNHEQLVGIVR